MTKPDTTPKYTPSQARHWFQQVAHTLSVIAAEADDYLNSIPGALDDDAANEVNGAFVSARTAADTCFGAAYRVAAPKIEPSQPQAYQAAASQPRY